jgi:hypothetical protein
MGSIPHEEKVRIYKPAQTALIAWNGEEEILYFSSELSATKESQLLEVMPLPSKPTVEKSGSGILTQARFLIEESEAESESTSDEKAPAGRVVEVKTLGVHEIHIVEVTRTGEFMRWVEKHLEAAGAATKTAPEALEKIISQYLEEGYRWFVFDLISVERTNTEKETLKIRFKTDKLYYPMRINRTEVGETEVEFFILTNILFNAEDCLGITRDEIIVPHKPAKILAEKLSALDPDIAALLGNPKDAFLRNWVVKGHLQAFTKDLLIQKPKEE